MVHTIILGEGGIIVELREVLAKNLKKIRKKKKMSQEELADKCGMSTRGYGDIERGKVNTGLDMLGMLSVGTQIKASLLIDDELDVENLKM